jgi:SNF2 family DNA or RNA helicase
MGLGKTVMMIALMLINKNAIIFPEITPEIIGATLIICPSSIITQWINQIHRFAPKLTVLYYKGQVEEFECLSSEIVIICSIDFLKVLN